MSTGGTARIATLALLLAIPGRAADAPILRVEPGGHTAIVKWLGFTPDGRFLLSAGDDKAIHVWDVADPSQPRLARTIRLPIGPGVEGSIFACALSPQPLPNGGLLLAVTGFPRGWGRQGFPIYLVEFYSGSILGALMGHTDVVNALAFSRDGLWLASGSSDFTARVWDLRPALASGDWRQARFALLKGHEDAVYGIAFVNPNDRAGLWRVVSGSLDQTLRGWQGNDQGWRCDAVMRGHEALVLRVAASPDGRGVASASFDGTVRFWDSWTGYQIGILGRHEDGVGPVAFAPDGGSVLAGDRAFQWRVWRVPKGGEITRFERHDNTGQYAAYRPDGALVATTGGNANDIYLWDPRTGQVRGHIAGTGRTMWAVGFSDDGRSIAYGNDATDPARRSRLTASFDLVELLPGPAPTSDRGWRRGLPQLGDLSVKMVSSSALAVQRGGRTVATIERERSHDEIRCMSFVPGPGPPRLVVGSNYLLTLHDANTGQQLRDFAGHTGHVWGVATSADGRYLVSASGDQTVRLWNLDSGEPLLALFVGVDKEWVAWTPQGYYASSAGGERIIGWHLNRPEGGSPEFYLAYQFRRKFHRPDIISHLLEAGSVGQAIRLADTAGRTSTDATAVAERIETFAPPRVTILAPADGSAVRTATITVRARIEDPNRRAIKRVTLLLNGSNESARDVRPRPLPEGQVWSREVKLQPGDNVIAVKAINDAEAESAPATVRVRLETAQDIAKPALYLLAVGVSTYQNPDYNLQFAAKDATDLARTLGGLEGTLYRAVETRLLTDQKATADNILAALDWLEREATERDYLMVFLAGHGVQSRVKEYYFAPHEFDLDSLRRTGVRWSEIHDVLASLPGKRILVVDTCHSAGVTGARALSDAYTGALRDAYTDEAGLITFASCMAGEISLGNTKWQNGAFTKAFVEALTGRADINGDRSVSAAEVNVYVSDRVKELTGGRQHTTHHFPATIRDTLPLAVVR